MELYIRCMIASIGVLVVLVVALGALVNYLFCRVEEYESKIEAVRSHITERIASNFADIRSQFDRSLGIIDSIDSAAMKANGDNRKELDGLQGSINKLETRLSRLETRTARIKGEKDDVREPKERRQRNRTRE